MKVGLVQGKAVSDASLNIENAVRGIRTAAELGAQVVCLQELVSHLYFATREKDKTKYSLAETIPGPTTDALSRAAKENEIILVGGSVFEKGTGEKGFNTAVVFDNHGNILGKYRKIHIPRDPHYWEQDYFNLGDLGYQSFDTEHGKIGVLICYDQWFPEASRILALQGAQVIFYPTAIGWTKAMKEKEKRSRKNWIDTQCMQAVMNHCFVAAVNRTGYEDEAIDFWGSSFVAGPTGKVLRMASNDKEEVLVVDCNLSKIDETKYWGFLENRRPETYLELVKRR